jgi:hypothetical protein
VLYHELPSPPPKTNTQPSIAATDAYERGEPIDVRGTRMSFFGEKESRDDSQVTPL